jgi:hypothetical protein
VVADTALALSPGASESLVRQLLAHEERVRASGQLALWLGLLTAVVALTAAVGQVERGANRIYGVELSAYTFTCRLAYGLTCRSAEASAPVRLS